MGRDHKLFTVQIRNKKIFHKSLTVSREKRPQDELPGIYFFSPTKPHLFLLGPDCNFLNFVTSDLFYICTCFRCKIFRSCYYRMREWENCQGGEASEHVAHISCECHILRPSWMGLWATCPSVKCPCPWQGVGTWWSLNSLPTQTFLWFWFCNVPQSLLVTFHSKTAPLPSFSLIRKQDSAIPNTVLLGFQGRSAQVQGFQVAY